MAAQSGGGGGPSAGAIKAGQAFVEFVVKDNAFYRGLGKAKAAVAATGAALQKAGAVAIGAGAAGLGAAGGVLKGAIDRGREVSVLAARIGATTEALSQLGYAAEVNAGVPLEELADTAKDLQEKLSEAAAESGGEMAKVFKDLGLNAAELKDADLPAQFAELAEALARTDSQADRTRLAVKIGGGIQKLLPLLAQGGEAVRGFMEEAEFVGASVGAEEAERADEAWRGLSRTWAAAKGVVAQVGAALLPSAEQVARMTGLVMDGAAATRAWLGEHRQAVVAVAAVAAGVTAAGAAVLGIGAGLSLAATAAGGFVAALGLVKAAALAAVSPVGLTTVAVAGLGYLFVTQTEAGWQWRDSVVGYFGDVAGSFKTTWSGISDALKAGDLALAGRVAVAALNVEFQRGREALLRTWGGFESKLLEGAEVVGFNLVKVYQKAFDLIGSDLHRLTQHIVLGGKLMADKLGSQTVRTFFDAAGVGADRAVAFGTTDDQIRAALRGTRNRADAAAAEESAKAFGDLMKARRALFDLRVAAASAAAAIVEVAPAPRAAGGPGPGPANLPPQVKAVRGAFAGYDLGRQLGGGTDAMLAVAKEGNRIADKQLKELEAMRRRIEFLEGFRWR